MSDFYKTERNRNVTTHKGKGGSVHAGGITVVAATGVPVSGRFALCKSVGSDSLVWTRREISCKRCLKIIEKDAR